MYSIKIDITLTSTIYDNFKLMQTMV